jgi:pyridinium-3,5-biscarboxylic acid mononucleotide sulfurtransferase
MDAPASAGSSRRSVPWLVDRIRRGGPALVALSGGVDSAVVAHLARRALGRRATAATLTGPSLSGAEHASARSAARAIGIRWIELEVDPLADPAYRANPTDRCYYCRRGESAALRAWGAAHGIRQYLDGVHADDLAEVRPGLRALAEAGVLHPLAAAGWGKAAVRRYAGAVGLPNADRPSNACLASRVAHGVPIERALLARLDAAEALVRAEGFRRVRVRFAPEGVRIVVDPAEVPRLRSEPIAGRLTGELRRLGFPVVTLDTTGYARPGGA